MKLLVSVVDVGEAGAAAAAGADIVDVKNPAEGSLGAPSPAVIAGVRAAVPAERPVSAAISDMPNLPGTAALAALGAARSGATFVKVGLWGVSTEDDAVTLLRAVRDGACRARWWSRGLRGRRCAAARALAPRAAAARSARRGRRACLVDTAVKDGRGLLEWLSPDALASLVAGAHAGGMQVALAGALAPRTCGWCADRRRHRRRPLGRVRRRQALGAARGGARPGPRRGGGGSGATPAAGRLA